MNPRDEKILSVVHKRQKADYENYVPFAVIHKSFPWIDGAELSVDLQSLCNQGYLQSQNFPTEYSGTALPHKAIVNMNVLNTMTRKLRKTELFN